MKNSAVYRHAHMLDDPLRTKPLLAAIKKTVRPGDAVLDIGTGLGLLAIAAAKAGAGQVYAVDCDASALEVAAKNIQKSGLGNKITLVHDLSFNLKFPKLVDVILCETVGSFAFDENILATLSDARKRLLKKGGRITPAKLELWAAPLRKIPKLDSAAEIASVNPKDLLGSPLKIKDVSFSDKIPLSIHARPAFKCAAPGIVRAFALWPRVTWWKGCETDASPFCPKTHWKQGILEIEPRRVAAGEKISIEFIIEPHPENPDIMTERLWRWI